MRKRAILLPLGAVVVVLLVVVIVWHRTSRAAEDKADRDACSSTLPLLTDWQASVERLRTGASRRGDYDSLIQDAQSFRLAGKADHVSEELADALRDATLDSGRLGVSAADQAAGRPLSATEVPDRIRDYHDVGRALRRICT